jgi:hypothetical protein
MALAQATSERDPLVPLQHLGSLQPSANSITVVPHFITESVTEIDLLKQQLENLKAQDWPVRVMQNAVSYIISPAPPCAIGLLDVTQQRPQT